ncbi:Na+/H+ antiporter NhaC family protein [Flammeovirga sp. EKP202]|uniref:Na+/H+ antiporter NhaC family protein n=1 Tax=Flammeovirga sp. EKP202 TaxID=2770592 RepID=UPI00165FA62D|nr:Na+/H+ antiporter NhaC family protein [Flammeovirga sp. EKP202]MBD0400227.1 Na+/H+ antiporter NhaC family protein [Flammeovirga sp. EKP202]
MENNIKKGNPYALIPLLTFLVSYLAVSIITGDFYKMPATVSFLLASVVALSMNSKATLKEKINTYTQGMGHSDIMLMCIIFLLAGAFGNVSKSMGAIDSTVNLALTYLPSNLLITGLFIIACFISISVGTSVGTIVAIAPIAVGIAEKTGMPIGIGLGAVIGGAMFGDNLSMISDTTIAAARTQGVEMRDKFRANIKIALPAAILTIVIYLVTTSGFSLSLEDSYEYSFIKVIPYLAVLVGALSGVNVLIVLLLGTLLSGVIGISVGSFDIWGLISATSAGFMGMSEIIILCLMIGGVVAITHKNSGIEYIIYAITSRINSTKGGELGIALLITFIDMCTANNTIAIIIGGPIAKEISTKYNIEPKRAASILDTFSCFTQGIIPYGAQILVAVGAAEALSPLSVIQYLYYPFILGICALGYIFIMKREPKPTVAA